MSAPRRPTELLRAPCAARVTRRPVSRARTAPLCPPRPVIVREVAQLSPTLRRLPRIPGNVVFPRTDASAAAARVFTGRVQTRIRVTLMSIISGSLTAEGGILIIYKDLDLGLRHTIWRLSAWSASTGCAWAVLAHAPVHGRWITVTALLLTAIINWLIVRKPVELCRSIEIRPDCMILEGRAIRSGSG